MFNWLLIGHFTNDKERRNSAKDFSTTVVKKGVSIYVTIFGPNINSPVQMKRITSDGVEDIGVIPFQHGSGNKYLRYLPTLRYLVRLLQRNKIKIGGVIYYGHSSGLNLGDYYHMRMFCTTSDFVETVLEKLKPKIMLFDSCYMGMISCIYEIARVRSIKYVMASPSFHPSFSVLNTESFSRIGTGSVNKTTIERHLRGISCEFQQFMNQTSYRCFLVFEMDKIPRFVKELKKALIRGEFKFDRSTTVVKADSMHDLYKAARTSYMKNMIKDISKHACNLSKCKVVRGLSIDIALPEMHLPIYKKMLWYGEMKDLLYKARKNNSI